MAQESVGKCVECGAQCIADGSLAVLCPRVNHPKHADNKRYMNSINGRNQFVCDVCGKAIEHTDNYVREVSWKTLVHKSCW
jgi:hypothetical protein